MLPLKRLEFYKLVTQTMKNVHKRMTKIIVYPSKIKETENKQVKNKTIYIPNTIGALALQLFN